MRLLIAEDKHALYAEQVRRACPDLQLVASAEPARWANLFPVLI